MYRYQGANNIWNDFLINHKLARLSADGHELEYIGPDHMRSIVETANEYLGEAVDIEELYNDKLGFKELYDLRVATNAISFKIHQGRYFQELTPMEQKQVEEYDSQVDLIELKIWHQTRISFEDLILATLNRY